MGNVLLMVHVKVASAHHNEKLVKLVTEEDSFYAKDIACITPLMLECFRNDLNNVKALLSEGVDINEVHPGCDSESRIGFSS